MVPQRGRIALLTVLALVAFAANSLLCRAALAGGRIDAASFGALRLASGALGLLSVSALAQPRGVRLRGAGDWRSASALFLYVTGFSFAYLSLTTGTGALILFGCVQLTMLAAGLRAGERPPAMEWIGIAAAAAGIVVLVFPGLAAPAPLAAGLMAVAGIAWGAYSLRGRGVSDPLAATCGNFTRAALLAAAVSVGVLTLGASHVSRESALLAVGSGVFASGFGYVLWYAALRGLTAARAALVQLCVPLLAALGGVALLGERLSARLVTAGILIVGGIGLALLGRRVGGLAR